MPKVYSRSIWFGEIDQALYDLIESTVYYKDDNGEAHFVEPCFPLNEEDLKKLSAPTVMIRSMDDNIDLFRYDDRPVVVSRTEDEVTIEDSAKPYSLNYQLEFLSFYREDLNLITKLWLAKVPKRYMLDVVDSGGSPQKCYMLQMGQVRHLNEYIGENKLFRCVIPYKIEALLDEGVSITKKIAKQVNLDSNNL